MSAQPSRPPVASLVWGVVVPGLLWLAVLVGMLTVVPRFEHLFRDFNLNLPDLTEVVLGVSRWVNNYWIPVLAAGAVAVLYLLRTQPNGRVLSRLWCWLMNGLAVVAIAVVLVAVYLPYAKLQEALSK